MICQQASVIFDKRKFCSRSTWQIDPFSISCHVSIVVIPNQITTAREKLTSPRDRAERWTTEWLVQSRVFGSDKSIIKSDAMSNEYRVTNELSKLVCNVRKLRSSRHHLVRDSGKRNYSRRDASLRVNKACPLPHNLTAANTNRSDFCQTSNCRFLWRPPLSLSSHRISLLKSYRFTFSH